MEIKLYDKKNIDKLDWPKDEWSQNVKNYSYNIIKFGTQKYISNINIEVKILKLGELILPITINNNQYKNSYVASIYDHYISYAKEELYLIKNKLLKYFLLGIINLFSSIFKFCKINEVVFVNNWFVSTNLYKLDLSSRELKLISKFLKQKYPNKSIVFRSINFKLYENIFKNLKKLNYIPIGSRQIYIYSNNNFFSKNSKKKLNKDFKLLENNDFYFEDVNKKNLKYINAIKDTYNNLYVSKYSKLNPQFSVEFIENAIRYDLINFKVLIQRNNNEIIGCLGYFICDNIMTTPFLGYKNDLKINSNVVYRMLSIKLTSIANENNYILNRSSGASLFKLARGSKSDIEYSLVYYSHLKFYRKVPWLILKFLINKLGIPIMKKYKL